MSIKKTKLSRKSKNKRFMKKMKSHKKTKKMQKYKKMGSRSSSGSKSNSVRLSKIRKMLKNSKKHNIHNGGFSSSCSLATVKESGFSIDALGSIPGINISGSTAAIYRPNCKGKASQAMAP